MATFNTNTTTADYGNENQAVGQLQSYLNTKGANLNVDNKYGDLTKAAVAKYGLPQSPNVTSANLAPVKESVLPDKIPSTYAGMPGAMESLAADARTQAEKERDTLRKEKDTSLDAYMKELIGSGSISSSVDRTAQDAAKKKSDIYTSQIEQEQLATRRRIEELQKNQVGMSATGLAVESERINRESLSKQADLAILQTAANREYDTAASIADRTVALKLEQSKANLEALKLLDSREYGDIQAKKEREYKTLERNEQSIRDIKLEAAKNGAGLSVLEKLSNIDTTKPGAFDEALMIAGSYTMSVADRIRNMDANSLLKAGSSNLSEKDRKALSTNKNAQEAVVAIQAKNLLDDYNTMVRGFGRTPSPAERKQANSFLVNVLAPKLSVALGQGGMTADEAKAKIDSLGLKGLQRREKITWNNIDSTILGMKSLADTSIQAVDSAIPGASDNYDIFKNYKISNLPPEEKARSQKVEAVKALTTKYDDATVLQYLKEQDPVNAQAIQTLYDEGYTFEEIMQNL